MLIVVSFVNLPMFARTELSGCEGIRRPPHRVRTNLAEIWRRPAQRDDLGLLLVHTAGKSGACRNYSAIHRQRFRHLNPDGASTVEFAFSVSCSIPPPPLSCNPPPPLSCNPPPPFNCSPPPSLSTPPPPLSCNPPPPLSCKPSTIGKAEASSSGIHLLQIDVCPIIEALEASPTTPLWFRSSPVGWPGAAEMASGITRSLLKSRAAGMTPSQRPFAVNAIGRWFVDKQRRAIAVGDCLVVQKDVCRTRPVNTSVLSVQRPARSSRPGIHPVAASR